MTARVFVTRRLPAAGLAPLREAGLAVDVYDGEEAVPRRELLRRAAGAAALVTLMSERVDDELLDAAGPSLRVVANYAVGYDNVDMAACARRGVAVANTPDVLTDATADLAFALLLAAARRLVEGDALVRSGRWTGWQPEQLLGVPVAGATLGLVGMGRIGSAVARRARGFGMRVLYHNRRRDEAAEAELGAVHVPLDELLAESDAVSLHVPLTPQTRNMIDAAALDHMKQGAILINAARGGVVDEAALVAALKAGRLGGAVLDVFAEEPLGAAAGARFAGVPNLLLTPHIAGVTEESNARVSALTAHNVRRHLEGAK